jgi:hypothetical protein
MKFLTAAAAFAVAALGVAASPVLNARQETTTSNTCNITTSQLTVSLPFVPPFTEIMYTNLMFANNSAYIGQIRYEIYSEPLIIGPYGGFTSQHQSPTGFVSAYVYPGETAPLQFTTPHSGLVPAGASTTGFNFTGQLWSVNGTTNAWVACPIEYSSDGNWTTAQIYWQGGAVNTSCTPVNLTQFVYGNPGT